MWDSNITYSWEHELNQTGSFGDLKTVNVSSERRGNWTGRGGWADPRIVGGDLEKPGGSPWQVPVTRSLLRVWVMEVSVCSGSVPTPLFVCSGSDQIQVFVCSGSGPIPVFVCSCSELIPLFVFRSWSTGQMVLGSVEGPWCQTGG